MRNIRLVTHFPWLGLRYSAYAIVHDANLFASYIFSRKTKHTTYFGLPYTFRNCFTSDLLIFTALTIVQINISDIKQ
jgi:hypothetical protein